MTVDTPDRPADSLDYELVFNQMPGLCLMLDPGFKIVAQTASDSVGRRDSGWRGNIWEKVR